MIEGLIIAGMFFLGGDKTEQPQKAKVTPVKPFFDFDRNKIVGTPAPKFDPNMFKVTVPPAPRTFIPPSTSPGPKVRWQPFKTTAPATTPPARYVDTPSVGLVRDAGIDQYTARFAVNVLHFYRYDDGPWWGQMLFDASLQNWRPRRDGMRYRWEQIGSGNYYMDGQFSPWEMK